MKTSDILLFLIVLLMIGLCIHFKVEAEAKAKEEPYVKELYGEPQPTF